eukprot:Hpha_TRINITY_DN3156_c0_g1::TRINITY_DN3156_c0_g1_i1::g.96585::m.96585/K12848/SNU23; U4/U6.U5 tri-snRNP component SNU23
MAQSDSTGGVKRKRWDKEEFSKLAAERIKQEADSEVTLAQRPPGKRVDKRAGKYPELKPVAPGGGPQRDWLRARDFDLGIGETVGRCAFINKSGNNTSDQPGWYCELCDALLRDSLSYADHVNGKRHQRMMGVSMRVQTATKEGVQSKLGALREEKALEEETKLLTSDERVDRKLLTWEEEEEQRKEQERAKKRRLKEMKQLKAQEEAAAAAPDNADDLMKMMGFSGFGKK